MPRDVVGIPLSAAKLTAATVPLAAADQIIVYQSQSLRIAGSADVEIASKGTTAQRPALIGSDAGRYYYDTTIARPVWWNGTAWRDSAGVAA